nr:hypothetical protein [uncultured Mucilaginibacter sp.]
MNSTLKAILLATIVFVVIFYVDRRIKLYDMSFYQGKDDGISARVSSIIFLSFLLFINYAKQRKIRIGLIGALVGYIASILGFIISYLAFHEYDLTFHIVSFSLALLIFIGFRRFKYSKIDS